MNTSMASVVNKMFVIILIAIIGTNEVPNVDIIEGTYLVTVTIEGSENPYVVESNLKRYNDRYFFEFKGNSSGVRDGNDLNLSITKPRLCDSMTFSYVMKLHFTDNNEFHGTSKERGIICAPKCETCVSDIYNVTLDGKLIKRLDK